MIPLRSGLFLAALLTLSACASETCQDRPCTPDQKLSETVKTALDKEPGLLVDQLHVHADAGTVYVNGLVSTYLEYQLVDQIGHGVPGVKRLVNATSVDNARY